MNRKTFIFKRITAVLLVALLALPCIMCCALKAGAASEKYTIVITVKTAVIRKDAGDNYRTAQKASAGAQYNYIGEKYGDDGEKWYNVKLNLISSGWVSNRDSQKFRAGTQELDACTETARTAAKYGTVGMQAAIIEHGKVTETFCFGYAVNSEKKMTEDAKIRIASLSKVFTSMNIMKLSELGVVDLDADISEYWGKQLPVPVTLRSLLTHTSTLADLAQSYKRSREETLAQLCSRSAYRRGEVGKRWMYNNYGMGIAGSTGEIASGELLDDIAHQYFLDDLGIDASFCSGCLKEHNYALTYKNSSNPTLTVEDLEKIKVNSEPGCNTAFFAGGLTISARDYAKLIAVLANDGEYNGKNYLRAETVDAMEQPAVTAVDHGVGFSQCMPMRFRENMYGQDRIYYHTGHAYGVLSLASYNPDTRCGVVVITTGAKEKRDSYGIYEVCGKITSALYSYIDQKTDLMTDSDAPLISSAIEGPFIDADSSVNLRTVISVDKDKEYKRVKIHEYGVVAAPAGLTAGDGLTAYTTDALIIPAGKTLYQDNGKLIYSGTITDIPESAFSERINVRGYILYTGTDGNRYYYYTDCLQTSLTGSAVSDYTKWLAFAGPVQYEPAYLIRLEKILGIEHGKAASEYGGAEPSAPSSENDNRAAWPEQWN